jgi:carboxypeptidase family protein
MPGKFVRVSLCILVAGSFMTAVLVKPARAQVLYGSVSGAVTDQSGAVVPAAQVSITSDTTGLKRQAVTDSTGSYRILDLPEGTYTVEVSATGFRPLKKTNISVVIGQVNEQDLQLQVGAVSQEVTVQGSAAILETEKADVHTAISSFAIENLPSNIYHNFQTIELLAPGVFSDSTITGNYPNSPADTPDRSLNIFTNGLPPRVNITRVDGATDLFVWLPNHMVVVPPEETIQEVNVQTSNFDVEKGLTAGAATDVVTKSGTNAVHGTLYGFHSDQALDARNLFDHTPRSPKNIFNNDGVAVGGPIKKDKVFYFANWDILSQRTNEAYFDLIPPMAYRQGDFSSALGAPLFSCSQALVPDVNGNPTCQATLNPIPTHTANGESLQLQEGMVFDPLSGDIDPSNGLHNGVNRSVFSSDGTKNGVLNVIPSGMINQGASNFWGLLPPPNVPGPFDVNSVGNYFVSKTQSSTRNIYTGKVDWNRSDKHAVWAKYTAQNYNFDEPFDFPQAGGAGAGPNHQLAQTVTVGHTYTLSPTLILTGHIGFTRMSENAVPPGFGKPLGETVLGIANSNAPENDIRYSGLPGLSYIGNFTSLGSNTSWEPVTRNDWTFTTSHNLTKIRGNHEFRFGVDAAHNHLNHFQPEILCCPRGNIYFNPDNTFLDLPADPLNPDSSNQETVFTAGACSAASPCTPTGFASDSASQNSLAVFDLGLMSETQKSLQFIKSTAKDTQFGAYFGDRWKVTPKFTADLGVRWEYFPIITRDGVDKFEVYDPTTNVLSLGGLGGNPTHLGVTASKTLFTPRIGLAYRWNDKTVFRAGFGIANDTLPLERPLRGFYPLAIGEDDFVPSSAVSTFEEFRSFGTSLPAIPGIPGGIPLIQPPDLSSGKITPPGDVIIGTLAPGRFKRAYIESWNVFAERQLPGQFLLDVGYVGNSYVHEFNGHNLNAGTIGGGAASQPLFANFGRTGETYQFAGYLGSHYNALQVSLLRHTYQGLYVQGSYTYSHAIGYTNDNSWENSLRFNCGPSPGLPQGCQFMNRGAPNFDHTHVLKMAFVYELPFGGGKKWANSNRTARAVLGGWQANGIISAWNGVPLQLSGRNRLQAPGTSNDPDQIGPVHLTHQHGPGQFWYDPASFAPVETARLGTVGRDPSWLRGPGLSQLDFSMFRHFQLTERFNLEARLEGQNATNHPHFSNPHNGCTDVNGTCGGTFGQIDQSYGERIVQIGMKLRF